MNIAISTMFKIYVIKEQIYLHKQKYLHLVFNYLYFLYAAITNAKENYVRDNDNNIIQCLKMYITTVIIKFVVSV